MDSWGAPPFVRIQQSSEKRLVRRSTRHPNLAISRVLGEEDRLTLPSELDKERKARFEPMLPVDCEAEALDIEAQAQLCVCNAQLRDDCLWHYITPFFLMNERDFPVPSKPRPVRVAVNGN